MPAPAPRAPLPREMMHLAARSDAPGLWRLGFHLAALGAAGWLVAMAPWWAVPPAILLLGTVMATLFAPMHETVHHTAFRSRWLNAAVGWVAAAPGLYDWHFYRAFHLAHHRHTQDPEHDPELISGGPPGEMRAYVLRLLGLPYWRFRFRLIADAWAGDMSAYPYIHPDAAPRVIASIRAMSLVVGGGCHLAALAFGWQAPLLFYVLPALAGQPVLRAYLLTEHTGCSQDRNGLTNTRTMLTSAPVRLLMWDMPFHAEHHLYPFIPFHRLAAAHALLRGKFAHVGDGYVRWHLRFLRALRAG
ncbi:fatty acid desaturase [Humitalea rosea]|uniref:Fatty acid desaturase n=2 Tax=Humitalea rosea TaxID=990373 RepID=A0A2W7IEU6_9PROT|nr:fatty acid desaturase [Humitalea rosea]